MIGKRMLVLPVMFALALASLSLIHSIREKPNELWTHYFSELISYSSKLLVGHRTDIMSHSCVICLQNRFYDVTADKDLRCGVDIRASIEFKLTTNRRAYLQGNRNFIGVYERQS